jgi:hypothetical protein
MAVAVEALPAAAEAAEGGAEAGASRAAAPAAVPRPRSSGGDWLNTGRAAYSRVSSPSAAAATITKLIWAVAVGLIVLEIAAEATGQRWSFSLPGVGRGPAPRQPYEPLYSGQTAVQAAMPGVFAAPTAADVAAQASERATGVRIGA